MPWKESELMNERLKFIGRLLQGEKMAELCREFGISRKTGYKFWDRYQKVGLYSLSDRGYFDEQSKRFEPLPYPFAPKNCVTQVSGIKCYLCLRYGPYRQSGGRGIRTHGTLTSTPVFKTGALNRSAIPPL